MVHGYRSGLGKYPWFGNEKETFDIFLYYKALALETSGAVIAVIVVGLYFRSKPSFLYEKRSYPPMLSLLVFSVLSILSSALASNARDASFGGYDRFEGCYVILSYVIIFFMAFGYARSIKLIQFLLDALLIGVLCVSLLGTFDAIGIEYYDWSIFDHILLLIEPYENLKVVDSGAGIVSSTLGNPNYVGSYAALVLPYCIYMFFHGDRLWRRILSAFSFLLLCIFFVGSESATGVIAVIVSSFVAIIFIFPSMDKRAKMIVGSISIIALAFGFVILFTSNIKEHVFGNAFIPNIENMETDFNSVIITSSTGKHIRVTIDEDKASTIGWGNRCSLSEVMSIIDEDTRKPITLTSESDDKKTINEEGYPSLSFGLSQDRIPRDMSASGKDDVLDVFHIIDGDYDFRFGTILGANLCYLYQNGIFMKNLRVLLKNVERFGFYGRYNLASGRGYIWACTIPVLKKYIVWGAGQDNFIYVFPNDDYVGKKYWGYEGLYVTKPHNLFLGIWVQQGLIALLAFLFLYILFIVRALRLCYRNPHVSIMKGFSAHGVVVITAIGTTGYMVAGLANDSIVTVTPLYWVLLGIGYAAEAICRRKAVPRIESWDENTFTDKGENS